MFKDLNEYRDYLAELTADCDQLQAKIDHGRIEFKDNVYVQIELDLTQIEVDFTREVLANSLKRYNESKK
jgi:hypothetical protein